MLDPLTHRPVHLQSADQGVLDLRGHGVTNPFVVPALSDVLTAGVSETDSDADTLDSDTLLGFGTEDPVDPGVLGEEQSAVDKDTDLRSCAVEQRVP